MTYLEAALSILRAAGRPLSSDEITERALNQGLIVPRGKTPVATMRAALYGGLHRPTNLVKVSEHAIINARPGSVRWDLRTE